MVEDYISREAAIEAVCNSSAHTCKRGECFNSCNEAKALSSVPAADVMPVVRCRECIYWEPASPSRKSGNCNRSFDIPAWANDFCSYGKRKDGGQDE